MNHKPTRHPAPGVTSWGVKVKLGAGAREGLTDPGHRSPAVTHTARNPRGPFVPVSLNFPFRDFFFFFFKLSSLPKQTPQKDFVTSDTGPETPHLASILGQPHPIGHEDCIAATVVPGASARITALGSLVCLSHPTALSHGGKSSPSHVASQTASSTHALHSKLLFRDREPSIRSSWNGQITGPLKPSQSAKNRLFHQKY